MVVSVELVLSLMCAGVTGAYSVKNTGSEREVSRGRNRVNSEQPVEPHTAFAELSEVPCCTNSANRLNHPLSRIRLGQPDHQSLYRALL